MFTMLTTKRPHAASLLPAFNVPKVDVQSRFNHQHSQEPLAPVLKILADKINPEIRAYTDLRHKEAVEHTHRRYMETIEYTETIRKELHEALRKDRNALIRFKIVMVICTLFGLGLGWSINEKEKANKKSDEIKA